MTQPNDLLPEGLEDRLPLEAARITAAMRACLDVLEFEKSSFEDMFDEGRLPKAFQELIQSDKVILSPHVGGWTKESYFLLSDVLADKIINAITIS
jgi:D-3-phosphoglycerate dehydrogenase